MNRKHFGRGSGVYTCHNCGRRTRQTGHGNEQLDLCLECFDMSGLENSMSDNGETPEDLAEWNRLRAEIVAKGGKLDDANPYWWRR